MELVLDVVCVNLCPDTMLHKMGPTNVTKFEA